MHHCILLYVIHKNRNCSKKRQKTKNITEELFGHIQWVLRSQITDPRSGSISNNAYTFTRKLSNSSLLCALILTCGWVSSKGENICEAWFEVIVSDGFD